jgi:hypothetical protein
LVDVTTATQGGPLYSVTVRLGWLKLVDETSTILGYLTGVMMQELYKMKNE